MTEQVDALIADAREWPRDGVNEGPLINALADALEQSQAELRQERERADKRALAHVSNLAALSRAEEAIEKVRACIGDVTEQWKPLVIADAITEYDKQKEGDRGRTVDG